MRPFATPDPRGDEGAERLCVLFADQLDRRAPSRLGLHRERDVILLAEVAEEAMRPPSHRQRTALFLAAMRHAALDLAEDGWRIDYRRLEDEPAGDGLRRVISAAVERTGADHLGAVRPGDWRALRALEAAAGEAGVELAVEENPHFLLDPEEFEAWASGRERLVLENFYRWMRRRRGLLLDDDGEPLGGRWNFDRENREPLGDDAPPIPEPCRFTPDAVTREVLELVGERFPDAPGELDGFAWPVTPDDAEAALADFVEHRLPCFGRYQDAMRRGEAWLFHSHLSPALNLGLLDPRRAVEAAVEALEAGAAPVASVEGFVRQIVGWREFVRGVYWREGPGYRERNHLGDGGRLPDLYWSGDTRMACLADAVGRVLEHGYGHHIERLMVTGNFALLAGVEPRAVADWYLGMYVDGVDWVTAPNTVGMAMFADGGVVGTKPYVSTGRYVDRMSDFCAACPYDPAARTGDSACPFSTLYWDFLARHRERLEEVGRMGWAWSNLDRIDEDELAAIRDRAGELRRELGVLRGAAE